MQVGKKVRITKSGQKGFIHSIRQMKFNMVYLICIGERTIKAHSLGSETKTNVYQACFMREFQTI